VASSDLVTAPPGFVRLAAHQVRWRLLAALAEGDHRVRELVARTGEPQNLVSYHLRLLRAGGLVTATRSSFDGRDSYYHLDLDRCAAALAETGAALHPALTAAPTVHVGGAGARPVSVLFVCTGNSARSPIAEALLGHRTAGEVAVTSAGIQPKPHLHPDAVRVLAERFGIDVAGRRPRHLDAVAADRFTHVITLCDKAREALPELPHRPRRAHWSIPDPAAPGDTRVESGYPRFERAAVDIEARVRHLLPLLATTHHRRRPDTEVPT
jgi:ArsR family transcriptional regulator, arsenate/arsenite/antimonite-responsive transcriptional repressor / arsenate reductase (thioredoxin)